MKRGFSLVELSIVLVILGLLVGGILAGQSLIRASALRKVGADFLRYETAINAFRDKYFYYPGDIINATQFWGAAAGAGAPGWDTTCNTALNGGSATGTATCNGDGNGFFGAVPHSGEAFRVWQHLSNAGLIEGRYNATTPVTNTNCATEAAPYGYIAGVNVPPSPMEDAVYSIGGTSAGSGVALQTVDINGVSQGNTGSLRMILLGKPSSVGTFNTCSAMGSVLSHEQTWNLDTKLDDGVAATGKVRAAFASSAAHTSWGGTAQPPCRSYFGDSKQDYNCIVGYFFGPQQ